MSSHCLLRALFSGPNKTLLTYSSQVSSPSPLIPRQFSMTLAQTQTLRRLKRTQPLLCGLLPPLEALLFSSCSEAGTGASGIHCVETAIIIRAMAFGCLPGSYVGGW